MFLLAFRDYENETCIVLDTSLSVYITIGNLCTGINSWFCKLCTFVCCVEVKMKFIFVVI